MFFLNLNIKIAKKQIKVEFIMYRYYIYLLKLESTFSCATKLLRISMVYYQKNNKYFLQPSCS